MSFSSLSIARGLRWAASTMSPFIHQFRGTCPCDACRDEKLAMHMAPILRNRAKVFRERGWIVDGYEHIEPIPGAPDAFDETEEDKEE
jgi:hypothetical protein